MKKIIALCALILPQACSESPDDPVIASYPDCKAEGQVGCISRAAFPAVNLAALTALAPSFKAGNTFVGITGTLANCASDNGVGCVASAEYPSVVKAEITATSVVNGSTLAGVAGSFAPPCTADAGVGCLATDTFKAVNLGAINTWDVRAGKTFAGLAGSASFYTSAATLDIFNRTVGDGSDVSTTVADFYDSIDDAAASMAIPILVPPSAPAIVSNWVREATTDTDADETCNGTEACVYTDLLTGLYWSADDAMTYTWEDAIDACDGLTIGAFTDWRLPTQKELLQAYVNRIYSLRAPLALTTTGYYSATTVSILDNRAWNITLATGTSTTRIKISDLDNVLCVR